MGIDLSVVGEGLIHAFTVTNLIWLLIGVMCGLFAGTLPGFSGGPMMAIMLPFVATQPIDTMLIALAGVYAGSVYCDSTTGIIYNIPGGASGIPATLEGFKLNQQGKLKEAFGAQLGGAFIGANIGFVCLLLLVPTFIFFVSFFGSAERALFAVWALVLIAGGSITKEDPLKSFLSVGVGLVLATIGQQPNVGTFRFHMGLTELWGGLQIVWVILATFALPQLFNMIKFGSLRGEGSDPNQPVERISFLGLYQASGRAIAGGWRVILRSSLLGVVIGIIPGIGTSTASWVGYSAARSASKEKEKFGKGSKDAVMGAESASNSCEVGTIIPLLSLGIPGSAGAAIMLAALVMAGISPGPSMYVNYGAQVWTIMFGIGLSAFMFTLLAYPFIKGAQSLSYLPAPALVGAIGCLCMLGSFLAGNTVFGNIAVLVLAILMVSTQVLGLKAAPLLIGFILGPGIEKELIRAYQIGGFGRFLEGPSKGLLILILLTIAYSVYDRIKQQRASAKQAEKAERSDESTEAHSTAITFLKDKFLALLSIGLAVAVLVGSRTFPVLASIWIYFIAVGFVLIPGFLLLFSHAFSAGKIFKWMMETKPNLFKGFDLTSFKKQVMVVVAFVIFIVCFGKLGYFVSSAIFIFFLIMYFDRKPVRAIVYSAAVPAALYLMKVGFGMYIPKGIFGI